MVDCMGLGRAGRQVLVSEVGGVVGNSGISQTAGIDGFLDRKTVRQISTYSDVHLWRLEKQGKFPRRVPLGPGRVGWLRSEIEAWRDARVAQRDARPPRRSTRTPAATRSPRRSSSERGEAHNNG